MDGLWKYIALGAFYAVCHSFLEEYYWRWFVFRRLHLLWSPRSPREREGEAPAEPVAGTVSAGASPSHRRFLLAAQDATTPVASAVVVSSLAFMTHHVILLATYFGWGSPWTYFFSACVAVGGALWAWLYERTGSLYGPWLSHVVVDAAIFVVGYDMARGLFA